MDEALKFASGLVTGMLVYDDLTGDHVYVKQLTTDPAGNAALQVDHVYLDGWRLPWEVSPPGTTVMYKRDSHATG